MANVEQVFTFDTFLILPFPGLQKSDVGLFAFLINFPAII